MVYQERLLLYADILGWRAAIECDDESRLFSVVQSIHKHAESNNERARQELVRQQGKIIQTNLGPVRLGRINPMAMEVQFGAFSDHFVFSVPDWFGGRILTKASHLMIDLLRAGFLTRGAVVVGPLYHCDNVIFGLPCSEQSILKRTMQFILAFSFPMPSLTIAQGSGMALNTSS